MKFVVDGREVFATTGGTDFDPAKPTVVFIHGVLNDHSVWILQTRYMANHGWNVLAPDLPGHGKSAGKAPASVQDAAAFVLALLDAAGVSQAALVGHSFGALIALELTARSPERVSRLVLVGVAYPMRVSAALLDAAQNAPQKGIDMVNMFSHSTLAPPPSSLGPGTWVYGGSRALMRRVLASNRTENVFYIGFVACDRYVDGESAMQQVRAPTLFILGDKDQMTPPRAAQALVGWAANAKVARVDAGHQMMVEAPDAVLLALRDFLAQ